MTCASCVDNIQRNLMKIEGIQSVLVALLAQRAEVKYDPTKIDPKQIENHINDLGFQAELLQTADRGMEMIDVNVNSYFSFFDRNEFLFYFMFLLKPQDRRNDMFILCC